MDVMKFASMDKIQLAIQVGEKWYCLEDAGGEAATEFRAAGLRGIEIDLDQIAEGGAVDIRKAIKGLDLTKSGDAKLELLSKCFREAEYNEETKQFISIGDLVPLGDLKQWPDRITNPICERLLIISELQGWTASPKTNPT